MEQEISKEQNAIKYSATPKLTKRAIAQLNKIPLNRKLQIDIRAQKEEKFWGGKTLSSNKNLPFMKAITAEEWSSQVEITRNLEKSIGVRDQKNNVKDKNIKLKRKIVGNSGYGNEIPGPEAIGRVLGSKYKENIDIDEGSNSSSYNSSVTSEDLSAPSPKQQDPTTISALPEEIKENIGISMIQQPGMETPTFGLPTKSLTIKANKPRTPTQGRSNLLPTRKKTAIHNLKFDYAE